MSGTLTTERPTATVPGATALPLPEGRPDHLRRAARGLEQVAAGARATSTVRDTLARRLGAVWTGDTAEAAASEASELARRAAPVVDALPAVARSLVAYASALEHACRRVLLLQREWDALDEAHADALVRAIALPDPTGGLARSLAEHADVARHAGRVRLSRSYRAVLDELASSAARCCRRVGAVTDVTLPLRLQPQASTVREVVTGGLWFADGAASARASRAVARADAEHLRALLGGAGAGPGHELTEARVAAAVARLRARVDDPVYAQDLLDGLGTEALGRLLLEQGTAPGVGAKTLRDLLATLGSVVVTATGHTAPPGTDPATRERLASGAALLADELVAAAAATVSDSRGQHRATGSWLLAQLLAGARLAGDVRPLPARLVRRLAAATASAELAETRDDDVGLRHGTTLPAGRGHAFATWFGSEEFSGDALHELLTEVGTTPEERAAALAERLPDSPDARAALANARGERLTLGEHLVRRWVTYEATGPETHEDLHLETGDDLTSFLASTASDRTEGGAETRARLMLELSRTSAYAMGEASTTRVYSRGPAALEEQVAEWLSAMHGSVDRTLSAPALDPVDGYVTRTGDGPQPRLDATELAGVVAALAVESGTGLHARPPAAVYDRLLEREQERTRRTSAAGGDVEADLARLGFLDQAASAALAQVARRQDELHRTALQALVEVGQDVAELRRNPQAAVVTMARTYAAGGSMRTPEEDLGIAVGRSHVELDQTVLDEQRRDALVATVAAVVGRPSADVGRSLRRGADRVRALPTADSLRRARLIEILDATVAVVASKVEAEADQTPDHARPRHRPGDTILQVAEGRHGRLPEFDSLPRGTNKEIKLVETDGELRALWEALGHGADTLDPGGYPGQRRMRSDGVEVRLRETSDSGGAAIDLIFPDSSRRKVHIR